MNSMQTCAASSEQNSTLKSHVPEHGSIELRDDPLVGTLDSYELELHCDRTLLFYSPCATFNCSAQLFGILVGI